MKSFGGTQDEQDRVRAFVEVELASRSRP